MTLNSTVCKINGTKIKPTKNTKKKIINPKSVRLKAVKVSKNRLHCELRQGRPVSFNVVSESNGGLVCGVRQRCHSLHSASRLSEI